MFSEGSFNEILGKAKNEAAYWAGYRAYFKKNLEDDMDLDFMLDDALDLCRRAENLRQSIIKDETFLRDLDKADAAQMKALGYAYSDTHKKAYVKSRKPYEDRIVVKALDLWRLRGEFDQMLRDTELPLRKRQKPRVRKNTEESLDDE